MAKMELKAYQNAIRRKLDATSLILKKLKTLKLDFRKMITIKFVVRNRKTSNIWNNRNLNVGEI